jgi:hypothetical protein
MPSFVPHWHFNRDILITVLSWLRGGSWHTVCRLCCRLWLRALPPVPHQHPSSPYDTVIQERDTHTLHWLLQQHVPWTTQRAFSVGARNGRVDLLHWVKQHMPACSTTLTITNRVNITKEFIRSGPSVLIREYEQIRMDPIAVNSVCPIFLWTSSVLSFAVRMYGFGKLHTNDWAVSLELCMTLCGGWTVEALYIGLRFAEVPVVKFLLNHPNADPLAVRGNEVVFFQALHQCAVRDKVPSHFLWELIITMAPDGVEMPWSALKMAVTHFQLWFFRAFLADQHCPVQRSGVGPETVAMAVLRLRHPDAVLIGLLMELDGAGVQWKTEAVLFAALDFQITHTLLEWLLINGIELIVHPSLVLLRCIITGCVSNLCVLIAHMGIYDPTNALYTTTAAENGHLEVLQYLRKCGYDWDCRGLTMALENNHLSLAHWALSNACPILQTPSTTEKESELRQTLLQLTC